MGVMDKFLGAMKLNEVEEDYDSEDYYEEEEEPVAKFIKKRPMAVPDEDDYEEDYEPKPKKGSQKVTPIRQGKRSTNNN